MLLTELPESLFLEIITYLTPKDLIRCRLLSTTFCRTLSQPETNVSLILRHFPRSRESRQLRKGIARGDDVLLEEVSPRWADIYARLARRYYHLGCATPRTVTKIPVHRCMSCLRGVTPWNKVLRLYDRSMPVYEWEPMWTFDPEEGLLVYPIPEKQYVARDLEDGREMAIPFPLHGKVVRRTRLKDGILIFEWHSSSQLGAKGERLHRHYVTSFDVKRNERGRGWGVSFRAEWNLHPAGSCMSHHARFFSVHNQTHYAIYIWEPLHSPWGDGNPTESLAVWEFGSPTDYRASEHNPLTCERKHEAGKGPLMVRELRTASLESLHLAQKMAPTLRGLDIDSTTWDPHTQSSCGHVFMLGEDHAWATGPHSSSEPPRQHTVSSVGIPLMGEGPIWVSKCHGFLTDAHAEADGRMSHSYHLWPSVERLMGSREASPGLGNLQNPRDDWPGQPPCWRHDDFPFMTVSRARDGRAGISILANRCFMLEAMSVHSRPSLWIRGLDLHSCSRDDSNTEPLSMDNDDDWKALDEMAHTEIGAFSDRREVNFKPSWWDELMGKRFIYGDERWLVGEDFKGHITVMEF